MRANDGRRKVSDDDVQAMRSALRAGQTVAAVAQAWGLHAETVHSIRQGRAWKQLPQEPPHSTLCAADVATIRERLAHGETPADLATAYGVTTATLYDIRAGRTWGARLYEKTGRPPASGPGVDNVRIASNGHGAATVFIGRAVWAALGHPDRVDLWRPPHGHAVHISPGTQHSVIGRRTTTQLRLRLSLRRYIELGLCDGLYAAVRAAAPRDVVLSQPVERDPAAPLWISAKDAARHAGVSRQAVDRWVQTGRLAVSPTLPYYIRRSDLDAFLEQRRKAESD